MKTTDFQGKIKLTGEKSGSKRGTARNLELSLQKWDSWKTTLFLHEGDPGTRLSRSRLAPSLDQLHVCIHALFIFLLFINTPGHIEGKLGHSRWWQDSRASWS